MADLVKYFRTPEGVPVRVKVEHDSDAESPRGECNGATLVTYERDYQSPDKATDLPNELGEAVQRWRESNGIDAYLVVRYARAFHSDALPFVAGLCRNGYDGALSLDTDPRDGGRWVGLAVVTREGWERVMGSDYRGDITPAEVAAREVERYSAWATGDCHGYVVEKPAFRGASIDHDPEVIDSCWEYIGEPRLRPVGGGLQRTRRGGGDHGGGIRRAADRCAGARRSGARLVVTPLG